MLVSSSYSLSAMDTLPDRDSPHPRDILMTFPNLPAKRRSPGRVGASVTRPDVLRTPLKTVETGTKLSRIPTREHLPPPRRGRQKVYNTRLKTSMKQQQVRVAKAAPEQSPVILQRQVGRPKATIATGMTKNTFVKKCKALDNAISALKKGMFCSSLHSFLQLLFTH